VRLDHERAVCYGFFGRRFVNVGVFGVGGVGGYFGAKICRALTGRDERVYFVARGAHLEAILARGLTVRTSSEGILTCRPALATDRVEALPALDAALVCVKSYDLAELAARIAGKAGPGTEIVPLLNGVDVYERMRERMKTGRIFPACVFIGTHIESPGIVSQQGGTCNILFGKDPHAPDARPSWIGEIFQRSGIRNEWHDDVSPMIWTKFVFIAAFGLVTACYNRTLGEVMASQELAGRVKAVMGEAIAIARSKGVALPPSILEDSYGKGSDFPPDTRTSFQRDFAHSAKRDERDLFGGTIIRMSAKTGVPAPATREIMEKLERIKPAG
jgi:2-dehydropantoate 2-reductase